MNQIIKIIKWEYLNRVKTKLFIFTTFLAPIMFALLSILPSWLATLDPEKTSRIGLVYNLEDEDLINRFKIETNKQFRTKDDSPQFEFEKYKYEEVALDSVLKKIIDGYLFIPESILDTGYANYYSLSLSNIKIYTNLKRVLNQVVIEKRMIDANIDVSLIGQLSQNVGLETYEIDKFGESKIGNKIASLLVPMIFVLVLFMVIFTSGQLLLRSVMEERTNRTIEILLSSVSPDQLMRGKILGLGLLGITQMTIYIFTAFIANYYKGWGILEYSQIPVLLIYFLLGYLFYACIFAMFGTFFTSEQEAQQSTSIITFIAITPFVFGSYFISNPGSFLTVVASYIPPLTPFMMIMRIGMGTVEINEIVYTTTLMVAFCWLMLKLCGKIFRITILMYGKKITFKEIYKWMRL